MSAAKLLLVEDDPALSELLEYRLPERRLQCALQPETVTRHWCLPPRMCPTLSFSTG